MGNTSTTWFSSNDVPVVCGAIPASLYAAWLEEVQFLVPQGSQLSNVRNFIEKCQEFKLDIDLEMLRIHLRNVRNSVKKCQTFHWEMSCIWKRLEIEKQQEFSWEISKIHFRTVRNLFEKCQKFIWKMKYLIQKYQKFNWEMSQVHLRNVWNTSETWQKFILLSKMSKLSPSSQA